MDLGSRAQRQICLKGEMRLFLIIEMRLFLIILFLQNPKMTTFQKLGGNKLLGPKGVAVADSGELIVIDNKGSAVFILHPASGKVILILRLLSLHIFLIYNLIEGVDKVWFPRIGGSPVCRAPLRCHKLARQHRHLRFPQPQHQDIHQGRRLHIQLWHKR